MKKALSLVLSSAIAALFSTSAFAACSHGYESADLSELKIAAETQKPQEAMSTFDPSKAGKLLETKKPAADIKIAE